MDMNFIIKKTTLIIVKKTLKKVQKYNLKYLSFY